MNIFPIPISAPGKIAIISRPAGNEFLLESIGFLKKEKFDIVLSALKQEEEFELGLKEENEICKQNGIQFISFPISDRDVPDSFILTKKLCLSMKEKIENGASIGVHCRAGIGRSSLLSSCILIHLGFKPDDAFRLISESRRLKVPDTKEQENWVYQYYEFKNECLNNRSR